MSKVLCYQVAAVVTAFAADADGGGAHREHRGGKMGKADDHFHMIGQMVEKMPALGCLQIPVALVPVQMAMTDGVILKGAIKQATHDAESLLCCFFRL